MTRRRKTFLSAEAHLLVTSPNRKKINENYSASNLKIVHQSADAASDEHEGRLSRKVKFLPCFLEALQQVSEWATVGVSKDELCVSTWVFMPMVHKSIEPQVLIFVQWNKGIPKRLLSLVLFDLQKKTTNKIK